MIISGCSRSGQVNKQIPELVRAEKVMFDHPDSALHILERMEKPSSRTDKENHALWCLLVTQAKYKQMLRIKSDSLIHIAYNYYKSTDNARRKAMAALYMGGVNYNIGNIEKSIRFYLEAKTEMEKTSDFQLGYLIMSGLGNIYLYRNLATYALESCTQAYDYAVKDSNRRYEMSSLLYLARCYCLLDKLDVAEQKYKQSSTIAQELGKKNFYYIVQQELASVYKNSNRCNESLVILKSLPLTSQVSLLIGQNYSLLNRLDSANYYLKEALYTDNIYTKRTVYKELYQLAELPKFKKNMKAYCDSLLYYNDSIIVLDRGKEIIAYKEKYNNERLITEKQKLELEKKSIINLWMFTLVIVLLLLIIFIYIYLRKRIVIHKKEEELANLALQLHEKELEVDRNESYIAELQLHFKEDDEIKNLLEEKESLLCKLINENEQLNIEKELLHEKIASYSISSCEITNIKILSDKLHVLEKREKELCTLLLKQIPLLRDLHLKPVYLNDAELKEICNIADNIFQSFTERLSNDVSTLSDHELILCSLIKLHFSITEISIFLNIASTSVSRSKLRVKNKICAELGDIIKDKSLDIWLWEY